MPTTPYGKLLDFKCMNTPSRIFGEKLVGASSLWCDIKFIIIFCPACTTLKYNPLPNSVQHTPVTKQYFSQNHTILTLQPNGTHYRNLFH